MISLVAALTTTAVSAAADPLMCGQHDLTGVNSTLVHYHQEGLAIFPCYGKFNPLLAPSHERMPPLCCGTRTLSYFRCVYAVEGKQPLVLFAKKNKTLF